MWWAVLLVTTGAPGAGKPLPPPLPAPTPSPEAEVLDRYVEYLDAGLSRRLRGRVLRRADLDAEDDPSMLGAAAGDAVVDWTGWVVSNLPGGNATADALLSGPSMTLTAGGDGPRVRAGNDAEDRVADRDRTLTAAEGPESEGAAPQLRVGLSPRLTGTSGVASGPDAVVNVNGRAMGIDEWRVAAEARQRQLSAFVRQGLTRELSLVAGAQTTPRSRALAEWTGGALVRLGSEGMRVYGHYTRAFAQPERPPEHAVGVTVSVVPERRRD